MKPPLLLDRPKDFSFTLSAKHLLARMFEIIEGTLDGKELPDPKAVPRSSDFLAEYQSPENATCSIGYTLTVENRRL